MRYSGHCDFRFVGGMTDHAEGKRPGLTGDESLRSAGAAAPPAKHEMECYSAFRLSPSPFRLLFAFCLLLSAFCLAPPLAVAQSRVSPVTEARNRMVDEEIVGGGINNPRVIQAMRDTPRHEFVPLQPATVRVLRHGAADRRGADDLAPFVVAYMTEQLDPQPTDKVLEIGTGSGYQAAVLSPLVKDVYTIEIVEPLGNRGRTDARTAEVQERAYVKIGDGYQGWPETCAVRQDHRHLLAGESAAGRWSISSRKGAGWSFPSASDYQQMLYLFTKKDGKLVAEALRPTLFVPMTGTAEAGREVQPDPLHPHAGQRQLRGAGRHRWRAAGWYYCRQMKVLPSEEAFPGNRISGSGPDGKSYLSFSNDVPGRMSRALQGFAVDGKRIGQIEVSAMIRGQNIVAGPASDELPQISLTFYDDNWAIIGRTFSGPYRGTFDWHRETERLRVPPGASKCIMHLGLLGATGQFDIDDVSIRAISRLSGNLGKSGKRPAEQSKKPSKKWCVPALDAPCSGRVK